MTNDDIDATLRRLGSAWRSATPDDPAFGPLEQTADVRPRRAAPRARRRVASIVAVGFVVSACAVASVLVGQLRPDSADRAEPVPAGAVPSPPAGSTGPTAAPACTAAQLAASIGPGGPAAGTENLLIVLTNHSGHACTLGGRVTLAGVHGDGTVDDPGFTSYTDVGDAPPSPAGAAGPVAPGAAGGFVLAAGLNCAPISGDYVALRITLELGPTIDLPWDARFSACHPIVGPAGPIPPVEESSTLASLIAEAQQ